MSPLSANTKYQFKYSRTVICEYITACMLQRLRLPACCSDCNCNCVLRLRLRAANACMLHATATATACCSDCNCMLQRLRLLTDKHIFLELPALQETSRLKPLHFHVVVVQISHSQNAGALSAAASKKKRKQKQNHGISRAMVVVFTVHTLPCSDQRCSSSKEGDQRCSSSSATVLMTIQSIRSSIS